MTPLERVLRQRILSDGLISVEAYMEACNEHYYQTRDPIGLDGDFTTAPEVSQVFGELIGAALADCWQRAGRPADAAYTELGPGRGTLASDALRVMRSAGFAGEVHFVETSVVLRCRQRDAVPDAHWHDAIGTLPAKPLLLVANEFLDALPVRQHVGGVERHVVLHDGELAFDRHGEIIETSPARNEVVSAVGAHLGAHGGVGILIDYGHEFSAPGDTLQAVRRHGYAPILASPGEQDLTSHVDFEAVRSAGRSAGARVTPVVTQGDWLKRLGIDQRVKALARNNPKRRAELNQASERLTSEDQMGKLFKVIALHSQRWPVPGGFA